MGDFDLFQPDSDSNFSILVDLGAISFVFSDPDCPIGGFGGTFRVVKETWFWCFSFFWGVSLFFLLVRGGESTGNPEKAEHVSVKMEENFCALA